MASGVFRQILTTIGAQDPETGGLLLGPIGSNDVTDFHFDSGGSCSANTYSPDHLTLNQKLKTEWMPRGIDFKGFVHSHPGHFDRLSSGDLVYIRRLLLKNEDMSQFAAPIVIPCEYRMRTWIVPRSTPHEPLPAQLMLF